MAALLVEKIRKCRRVVILAALLVEKNSQMPPSCTSGGITGWKKSAITWWGLHGERIGSFSTMTLVLPYRVVVEVLWISDTSTVLIRGTWSLHLSCELQRNFGFRKSTSTPFTVVQISSISVLSRISLWVFLILLKIFLAFLILLNHLTKT